MQPANVYVEWWVGGDHLKNKKTKLLKQGVKKGRTKAEPSGQKKNTNSWPDLLIQQLSTDTQIHLWTLRETVSKWVILLKDKELSYIALSYNK